MRCEVGAWQTRQVVITGFGAVTPLGNDRETIWRNLIDGNSGVGPITAFDASDLAVRIAAEVRGFDPAAVLDHSRRGRGRLRLSVRENHGHYRGPAGRGDRHHLG
jgi:3-oxoacyl-(acyl-carrier-protein) synthase